jgi:hypothetical protein
MRHPEVENLHLPLVRDEHVRGLEIPVDHPLGVGVGESPGNLRRDVHRLLDRQRAFLDPQIKRLPTEQLEDEIRPCVATPDVKERDEVGMQEPRDRLGLAGDPSFLLDDASRPDDLHGHLPAEVPVPGLVDHAEPAAPQLAQDLEPPDDRSGRE